MVSHEFEGKTTEEAIQNASRELNIPAEELDVEIIEPGSAGIFGLVGSKKARVKVIIETEEDDFEEMPEEIALETPAGSEENLEKAKELLENILALMPVETTVTADISGELSIGVSL